MIWLDWCLLVLVVYNLVSGLFSGLIRSLINLVALISAFLLTPVLKTPTIILLQNMFDWAPELAVPVGTSLTWTGVYVLISIVGLIWAKVVSQTPLKWIDRLGGAAFGLLVSGLLILVPLAVIQSVPILQKVPPLQETLNRSALIPYLDPGVRFVRFTVGPSLVAYLLPERDETRMKESIEHPSSPSPQASPQS